MDALKLNAHMRKSRDFTVYFPNLKGNLLEVD